MTQSNLLTARSGKRRSLLWKAALTGLVVEAPFVWWIQFGHPAMHGYGTVIVVMTHVVSITIVEIVMTLLRQNSARTNGPYALAAGIGIFAIQAVLIASATYAWLLARQLKQIERIAQENGASGK
jgi:hypothetical protein